MFIYFILPRYYMVAVAVTVAAVVSKHIIIKKNVVGKIPNRHTKQQQHTTQNKVNWSEVNQKNIVCNTKQKRTSSELFTIYARIWIWYTVMLLLLFSWCCYCCRRRRLFFCHIHQIIVEWMNEQTNCIKRVCAFFERMCVCVGESLFFCFYFFFIIIEN